MNETFSNTTVNRNKFLAHVLAINCNTDDVHVEDFFSLPEFLFTACLFVTVANAGPTLMGLLVHLKQLFVRLLSKKTKKKGKSSKVLPEEQENEEKEDDEEKMKQVVHGLLSNKTKKKQKSSKVRKGIPVEEEKEEDGEEKSEEEDEDEEEMTKKEQEEAMEQGLSARFLVVGLVVPRVLATVQVEPPAVFLHLLHGQGGFLGGFILVHNVGRVFAQLFQPFPRHGHGALLDRSVHTLGILF